MTPRISLTGILAAVMLFAVAIGMHEAAKAESLMSQGINPVANRLVTNQHGKKPLGFKGAGGMSHVQDHCQYANDHIVHCDDCDVDWDQSPPQKVCITNAICYDGANRIECPPLP